MERAERRSLQRQRNRLLPLRPLTSRRHREAPPHFPVVQLPGGGEPGCGGDSGGSVVTWMDVRDDGLNGLPPEPGDECPGGFAGDALPLP